MLKPGIVTVDGLRRPAPRLAKQRHASFLLLRDLAEGGCDDSALYDRIIERVRLPNGIWKQTGSGRLRDVDATLVMLLESTHAPQKPVSVLDLAVSTGVTSVELYEMLRERFAVDFVASDFFADLFAVRPTHRRWAIVMDGAGAVLQHVIGPFVLPGQIAESAAYPVNRVLKRVSNDWFAPRARATLAQVHTGELSYFTPVPVGEMEVMRLPLLSYRCLDLIEHDPRFRFVPLDILRPLGRRAFVVRAMNIITPDHFDPPTAKTALLNCAHAVEPGGILITGRSNDTVAGREHVTFYRVANGRLTPLARLHGGCELESVATELRLT
jgi:hypothetical protein